MRPRHVAIVIGLLLLGSGCGRDDRQWMKINQQYTTADFRRDLAACSKDGKLNDECMASRGWVPVGSSKSDKDPDPRPVEPTRQRPRIN